MEEDLGRYALAGTSCVLMEMPFTGGPEVLLALGEHAERSGFLPVVAHPERTEAVLNSPTLARSVAERGWPLQVNSTSLLGRHGPVIQALAFKLIEEGTASVVASDGHRMTRPAQLDAAFEAVSARVGERAARLFDGSALGVATGVQAATPR